jgi:hypothetical protein
MGLFLGGRSTSSQILLQNRWCNSHWLKHVDIPEELLKVFPQMSTEISKMEKSFHTIKKTENTLKQLKFNDKLNQLKLERIGKRGNVVKASAMSYFVNLFNKLKVDKDIGVDTDSILCHAMFTAKDEYKSQGPHSDYDYQVLVKDQEGTDKCFYAWTALLPITPAGSWLHIWSGTGYGRKLTLNIFLVSFLDSGRIEVDMERGEKYHCLHFYLSTKFQVADPDIIN